MAGFLNLVDEIPRLRGLDFLRRFELENSLEPLLRRTDHSLMQFGIEGRTPYLHGRVPFYAFNRLAEDMLDRSAGKIPLRNAYADLLSRYATNRKVAFRAPTAAWFLGSLGASILDRIRESLDLLEEAGVQRHHVNYIISLAISGSVECVHILYLVLSLSL